MSQRITIEIKDKIATCLTELPIVCGNADYVVDFVFDEEWNAHNVKTAIFVVNGKATPQVFEGNVCPVPVIQNTLIAWVGVFVGTVDDGTLSTSTPALVKCIPCITDGDNIPMAPPDDVYNQIIQMINDGKVKGDKGEKGDKGDKGDAGSVKFVAVAELPTENIEEDAIYLLPMPDGTGDNTFNEYVYIGGKWESLGAITIQVDHSEYVKFTDYATANKAGVVKANGLSGVGVSEGILCIYPSENINIKQRTTNRPITPLNLDYAVKVGMTDNKETWTDEEKASACETIGAVRYSHGAIGLRYAYTNTENGTPYMMPIDSYPKTPWALVRRAGDQIKTVTPVEGNDVPNKDYVDDNFVDRVKNTSGFNRIYGVVNGTTDTMTQDLFTPAEFRIEDNAKRRYGVPYYSAGRLGCAPPENDYETANKKYVDDNFTAFENKIDSSKASKIAVSVDSNTYVATFKLLADDGTELSIGEITLPFESVVVGGYYDDNSKKVKLELQGGGEVEFSVADLVDGLISSSEKGVANGVATLDVNGKVPTSQIPESIGNELKKYVDDNFVAIPTTDDDKEVACAIIGAVPNGTFVEQVGELSEQVGGIETSIDKWKEDVASSHTVNITDISRIYGNASELPIPPSQGNGARYPAWADGKIYLYEYSAETMSWSRLYQVKGSTIYIDLKTNSLYRYTMSDPYFIRLTKQPEEPNTEEWKFTLEDGKTTVTKKVCVK